MEIQSLKLVVTEKDLNDLVAKCFQPTGNNVRDLRVRLIRDRLCVCGVYQAIVNLAFESYWQLSIDEGKIAARLDDLRAGLLGLGLLKSFLLDAIAAKSRLIKLAGDRLLFDPDWLLIDNGIPLRTHLTAVRCTSGQLILESGGPPAPS